ncbi:hypothetical protein TorRG33x02_022710, partial [Trema orientale]
MPKQQSSARYPSGHCDACHQIQVMCTAKPSPLSEQRGHRTSALLGKRRNPPQFLSLAGD